MSRRSIASYRPVRLGKLRYEAWSWVLARAEMAMAMGSRTD